MNRHDTPAELIQAVQKATRRLASTGDFDLLLRDVLMICVEAVEAEGGTIYLHDPDTNRLRFKHVLPPDIADKLPARDIADDYGLAGEAFQKRSTIVRDMGEREEGQLTEFERATGVIVHSMVAVPLMMEAEAPIGVVQLLNKRLGPFTTFDVAVLEIVAAVSTMAFSNVHLTEEVARASGLLGMGKVSHDIGNMAATLSANLEVADLSLSKLCSELEKANTSAKPLKCAKTLEETLSDLKLYARRITGYARLISDLSAGRDLRPEMATGSMAEAVERSVAYYDEEARRLRVRLICSVDRAAPPASFDELFLFRIVQNLVGNALKAVQEERDDANGGETVEVRYRHERKAHVLEVTDTGPGMSSLQAERILSGNARSQWERASGSGWGLRIVLELATAHNATVGIASELGVGTTFRVEFPEKR